jgi:hypothetical protein
VLDTGTNACLCITGFFSETPSADCKRRPAGAECGDKSKGCTPTDFELQPGFWRTGPTSSTVIACPVAALCPQAGAIAAHHSACAAGHTGAMCTVCAGGWARSTRLHCEVCEGGDTAAFAVWLTLCLLMLPLAYAALRSLKRLGKAISSRRRTRSGAPAAAGGAAPGKLEAVKGCVLSLGKKLAAPDKLKAVQGSVRNLGKKLKAGLALSDHGHEWWHTMTVQLKITLTFLQVLSQIHIVYDIPYPESFVVFVERMAFLNLDFIDVMRVGCVARVDFYGKLFAVTLVPLFVSALMYAAVRYVRHALVDKAQAVSNMCTKAFMLLTFIIFPSVSTTVLRAFPCHDFDDDSSLLKADYSIDCNAQDRHGYVFYAALMTIIYPIGIPVLCAVLLWKQRHLVCPKLETEKMVCGVKMGTSSAPRWQKVCGVKLFPPPTLSVADDDALLAVREKTLRDKDDDTHAMLRSTQFLFKEYKPRYWWFEVFECARRLMLTGGTVFFLEGSATQVAAGILVSLVSIQVYAQAQPYIRHQDNVLAMTAQWGIFFTLFIGLLLKTKVPSNDGYGSALGGLLIFVNGMVIVLAAGTFLYLIFQCNDYTGAEKAEAAKAAASADPADGTMANPVASATALSNDSKKKPNLKQKKTAHGTATVTNPAMQGNEGDETMQELAPAAAGARQQQRIVRRAQTAQL